MAQTLTLAAISLRLPVQEWLRLGIVCGCALALICAGKVVPLI